MCSTRLPRLSEVLIAAAMLLVAGSLAGQNKKNNSSPPPPRSTPAARPAPAPRPAPAARPANSSGGTNRGGSINGPSANRPGPSVNGPTASRSTGSSSMMANRPTANGPTTANRSAPTTNRPNLSVGGTTTRAGSMGVGSAPGRPGAMDAGGHNSVNMGRGRTVNAGISGRPAPRGAQPLALRNGSAIQRRPNGRISDVHDARRGLDIHHGLNGSRRVSAERADHSRIFAERGRPGFVQRPYSFRSHDFSRRTYYYHGHAYDRFYRPYLFHGVAIEVYAPVRYYSFGFYGWAYNPWPQPIMFAWGWGPSPWAGYYGGYFAPSPVYTSAPYWLTDYMVSQDLAADYQAGQDAQTLGPPPQEAASPELTPEIKQEIANEVQAQLALESHEAVMNTLGQDQDPASSGIARLLSDGHSHAFVVGNDLDVVDGSGAECALSGGDVLGLNVAPPTDAEAADLVVLASKGGPECQKQDSVTVALNDLQDMQNHMRETIDQGLQELQSKQGTGGLPAAPPSAKAAPVETAFAQMAPPPDPNDGAQINQQLQQADAAETDVVQQAQQESGNSITSTPPAAPAATVTVSLGQTFDQVTGALGQPLRVIDLGTRKIYQYQDMKVTFKDGKVADVQ